MIIKVVGYYLINQLIAAALFIIIIAATVCYSQQKQM